MSTALADNSTDLAIKCLLRALQLLEPQVPAPSADGIHPLITVRAETRQALRALGHKV